MMLDAPTVRRLLQYNAMTGEFTWRVPRGRGVKPGDVAGTRDVRGYVLLSLFGKKYLGHRIAWLWMTGDWPSKEMVDHINGDKADNRWANLREATRAENCTNSRDRPRASWNARGVGWSKHHRHWTAVIGCRRETLWLGNFKDRRLAVAVRNWAAEMLHGEFARAI